MKIQKPCEKTHANFFQGFDVLAKRNVSSIVWQAVVKYGKIDFGPYPPELQKI